ncbi:phage portal protein family protein, partial [Hoyosella altamirensis]
LPSTLTRINVADDGGLASIEQTPRPGSSKQVVIPVDRLVAYVHDPEEMDWRGTSMLRAAYKHWLLKDQFLRLEGQVLDRNGMGVPVYTAGEPGNQEEIDRGQKMASELRSGSSSGASIPNEAKLEILGVKGQLVSPREAIAYHDAQIGRSALAHFLNLSDKGGSYALADTQAEIFVQALQTIAEDIADTANQHLVEEMVQVAFDSPGPYPRIVFDPIGTKKELTAEALSILINAGLILPDKDLEEEMRRRYGLPPKRPLPGTSEEDGSA